MSFCRDYLNFYPDTIDDVFEKSMDALEEAGYSSREIRDIKDAISEYISEIKIGDNLTNDIMGEILYQTQLSLEEKLPDVEISYYVNGDDTHLYIGGEEYYGKGDGVIQRILEEKERNVYDVAKAEETTFNGKPAVRLTLNMSDENLEQFLDATYIGDKINEIMQADPQNIDGFDFKTEFLSGYAKVDVSAVVAEDGSYFYEVNGYTQSTDEFERIEQDRIDDIGLELTNETLADSIRDYLDNGNASRTPRIEETLQSFADNILDNREVEKQLTDFEKSF